MQKPPGANTSRRTRRIVDLSVVAACASLLCVAACTQGEPASSSTDSARGGTAPSGMGGNGASSGVGASAAGAGTGAGIGGFAASGGASAGGAPSGSGGLGGDSSFSGNGGANSGGANGGAGGAEPCVDVEPPPDPQWPEATCSKWATETQECAAPWFAEYCNASCGRCVPAAGAGAGGAGGSAGEACVDVEPPPDPEWPGATCRNWATETQECSAPWFAEYCDASCGRCVTEGGSGGSSGEGGTGGSTGVDCSGEGLPNVTGGDGYATRYWDCCQPHCAQFDGHRCGQDGISITGDTNSACTGGGAFACYDGAPRAVSDCLSYGHIAKASPDCGACYRIQFTGQGQHDVNDPGSKLIAGKQMIVKVTNTGSDVAGNQFDLMIPGGGVGRFNACSTQWGTDDLGAQYGGFLTDCAGSLAQRKECVRLECMKIPQGPARDGCLWFVDWLHAADNPKFTSEPTSCPF